MRTNDAEALQSSYGVYAKEIVDRRKSDDLFDNSYTVHLEKSGFLKELWGSELSAPAR